MFNDLTLFSVTTQKFGLGSKPSSRQTSPNSTHVFFMATHHVLAAAFRQYGWPQNMNLILFLVIFIKMELVQPSTCSKLCYIRVFTSVL
jgi:hypothetical protein